MKFFSQISCLAILSAAFSSLALPLNAQGLMALTTSSQDVVDAPLIVIIQDYNNDTSSVHDVTDMGLEFGAMQGVDRDAMNDPNQPGRDPAYRFFDARLIVIAGGHLYPFGYAMCSLWEEDISICQVECDGGDFALRRDHSDVHYRLTTVFGPATMMFANRSNAAVTVESCGEISVDLDVLDGEKVELTFSRWR